MSPAVRIVIFLVINFGALAIGGLFTGEGVPSQWYKDLNKAPWTPPGWVFGAAWSVIMIALAFFMSKAWGTTSNRTLLARMFGVQLILNILWNPVFFYWHATTLGLVVISALTLLVAFMMIKYRSEIGNWAWLLLPYFIWLCIATSLNAYVVVKN